MHFENLSVAAATVPREDFAADGEFRDSFVCNIAGNSWRFRFLSSSILLLERICVHASLLSQPISRRFII